MNHKVKLPWVEGGASNVKQPAPKTEWGPRAWHWLHSQAINYPAHPSKTDQTTMFARFWSFIQTLPCADCRVHATKYASDYPPDFSNSSGFQTWAWRFHNTVNRRLGKDLMTAEEYREAYAEEITQNYWKYVV